MYLYQVNYSIRVTSGNLINRLYHRHLRFEDWQSADKFRAAAEEGNEYPASDGNGSYRTEDVSLFAIEPTTQA